MEGQKPEDSDVLALIDRLEEVFRDVGLYKMLLRCRGSDAQELLNTFQLLLDTPMLHTHFRRSLIIATQRLSKKSGLYPACYELRNVVQEGQDPVTAGGFADIYKGHFEGQAVCIKAVRIYRNTEVEDFLKQFSKEAILWGQLFHINVLPIYGLYHFSNRVCLVSPWMNEGDINHYLRRNPHAPRLRLAVDVAQGLSYLHKNGIIHGDLKGPNILVTDAGIACLADFGISSVSDSEIPSWTSHSSAASSGGSIRWQAPELFDMEGDQVVKNSVKSDVYAWSCVCYEIFAGFMPFVNVLRESAVILQIKSGHRPVRPADSSPSWCDWGLTESTWALMQDCWEGDPIERPAIEEVIERLIPDMDIDVRRSGSAVLSPWRFRERTIQSRNMISVSALEELLRHSGSEGTGLAALTENFPGGVSGAQSGFSQHLQSTASFGASSADSESRSPGSMVYPARILSTHPQRSFNHFSLDLPPHYSDSMNLPLRTGISEDPATSRTEDRPAQANSSNRNDDEKSSSNPSRPSVFKVRSFWRDYIGEKITFIPTEDMLDRLELYLGYPVSKQHKDGLGQLLDEFGKVSLGSLERVVGAGDLREWLDRFIEGRTSKPDTILPQGNRRMLPLLIWVDDNPDHNQDEILYARQSEINVIQLRSTANAKAWVVSNDELLRQAHSSSSVRVISDNHRNNDPSPLFQPRTPGEEFLRFLRKRHFDFPVLIYTGPSVGQTFYVEQYGRAGSTSSSRVCFDYLTAFAEGRTDDIGRLHFMM